MAILGIPLTVGAPFQKLQVELDKVVYGVDLRWNHRSESWALALRDSRGTLLASGIRLCFGTPLLPSPRPLSFPPGELLLVDAVVGAGDPTLTTLGREVELVYADAAEVAALVGT